MKVSKKIAWLWKASIRWKKTLKLCFWFWFFLAKQVLQNHPVHVLNEKDQFSSSSFIPFCSFGDQLIGSEIEGFGIKVCNIFKQKLYHDQLCFETDLQNLKDNSQVNLNNQLNLGLTLVIDYNEERQINPHNSKNGSVPNKKKFSYLNNGNSLSIYLDTISIIQIITFALSFKLYS